MEEQDKLYTIDEIRELEGLGRSAHKSLEEICENLNKIGMPCFTLAQSSIGVD